MRRYFVAAIAAVTVFCSNVQAETIYGLTNLGQIVTFDSSTRVVTQTVSPTGLSSIGGEMLRTIDVRPVTGQLYGLSSTNRLFILDPTSNAVTLVGTLSTAPAGGVKAIDFNPFADALRIHGSATTGNNNLRGTNANFANVIVDGSLAFMAGDTNAGDAPSVVNAGYFNSVPNATSTTLYVIEAGNDVLATQNPANAGTLQTVGALGFDIVNSAGFTGFDISGSTDTAYLVGNKLGTGGLTANSLYQVNLATGAASLLGGVSGVNGSFRDIAVAAPVVPEPTSIVLVMGAIGAVAMRSRRRS